MRKLAVRSVIAAVAAGIAGVGAMGAGVASADPASSVVFSPTVTLGTLMGTASPACIGYLDAKGSVYPGQTPGPVAVLLSSHFVGVGPQCFVEGTVNWKNLDTGATGSRPWSLSGYDGPGAPTGVYFDPGRGRISIEIDSAVWCVPGTAQLTV